MEEIRRWYESLAQERMLVGYDRRGTGLSDRQVADYSLDAQGLDLEAIVERLGITQFALFAGLYLGPAAIAYAARHRDKVTHLLLWCTSPRAPPELLGIDAKYNLLEPLMETDWERYAETVAHWVVGWEDPQETRTYAAFLREGSTPESLLAYQLASWEFDASPLLNEVQCPTLVLHRRSGARRGQAACFSNTGRSPDSRRGITAIPLGGAPGVSADRHRRVPGREPCCSRSRTILRRTGHDRLAGARRRSPAAGWAHAARGGGPAPHRHGPH